MHFGKLQVINKAIRGDHVLKSESRAWEVADLSGQYDAQMREIYLGLDVVETCNVVQTPIADPKLPRWFHMAGHVEQKKDPISYSISRAVEFRDVYADWSLKRERDKDTRATLNGTFHGGPVPPNCQAYRMGKTSNIGCHCSGTMAEQVSLDAVADVTRIPKRPSRG